MRVIFAGTPQFSVPSLDALLRSPDLQVVGVYTQPDRPAGRGRKIQQSAIKTRAVEYGLDIFQPDSLKQEQSRRQLKALNPDLIIVTAYGLLLPQAVLDIPSLGCINVHASVLPRWRGAAPIQRAIEFGDSVTGVSLMKMVRKLDAGAILSSMKIPINENDTAASLHDKLSRLGGEILQQNLQRLMADGGFDHGFYGAAIPQNEERVTYAEKLRKHQCPLDLTADAEVLARRIRAFNPWPLATLQLRGNLLRIYRAKAKSRLQTPAKRAAGATAQNIFEGKCNHAGRVIEISADGIVVATGKGFLQLEILQRPGGKPLGAQEFLNGFSLKPGDRFDLV